MQFSKAKYVDVRLLEVYALEQLSLSPMHWLSSNLSDERPGVHELISHCWRQLTRTVRWSLASGLALLIRQSFILGDGFRASPRYRCCCKFHLERSRSTSPASGSLIFTALFLVLEGFSWIRVKRTPRIVYPPWVLRQGSRYSRWILRD